MEGLPEDWGLDLSLSNRTWVWKRALERALSKEFPEEVRGKGLKLIRDNGSEPTWLSFIKDMVMLGIKRSLALIITILREMLKTKRMLRTIKEELLWLKEFSNLEGTTEKIGRGINDAQRGRLKGDT